MAHTKRILTISRDGPLQASRTLLLENVGYAVIPLDTDLAVLQFLELRPQPEVNLVLMCHSVPEKSRVSLCKAFKERHPHTPILMLYNAYDPTAAEVDGRLENLQDPKALIETLHLLLHPVAGMRSGPLPPGRV